MDVYESSGTLLRRITQHVKEQNWTAITLDLVIIIVGVFIGIQVANWNDARTAAKAEAQLLNRLSEELKILEEELAEDADRYAATAQVTAAVLASLRAGSPPADEASFRRALWRANHYYEIPALSPT